MPVAEAETRPALITLSASEPYRTWLGSLARRLRTSRAAAIDAGLVLLAQREGLRHRPSARRAGELRGGPMPSDGPIHDLLALAGSGLDASYLDALRAGVASPVVFVMDLFDAQAQAAYRIVTGGKDPEAAVARIRAEHPDGIDYATHQFALPLPQAIHLASRFDPAIAARLAGPVPDGRYFAVAIAGGGASLIARTKPAGAMPVQQHSVATLN